MLNSVPVEAAEPLEPARPASHDATQLTPIARIVWAGLIVATLGVCYFSHLGAVGFVGPDEPRYAWIARDMAETGDWVTPRLYGKPWFEKPPLYYWSAAVSFRLFGVSETAARLPSAVAALLATLALAWMALRLYGAETARWLLLLLPTSVGMIGFSHAASTDMLFSATLTLALVTAVVILRLFPHASPNDGASPGGASPAPTTDAGPFAEGTASRLLVFLFFGFFLGLAVLAKGPAALILLGGAVFFWAVFTKRWRDAFRLFHPLAITAFCLTALPWYVLCARRNPDFFRVFIIEHNFKRFLTPEFQHIQPFWYYSAVLLIALLPWTALLLWSAIASAIRPWRTRAISPATCLLLCWAAFCLLFFSVSKSKLPGYILPAIPAILLLAVHTRFVIASRRPKSLVLAFLSASFLFAVVCALAEGFAWHRHAGLSVQAAFSGGLFVGAFAAGNLSLALGAISAIKNRAGVFVIACAVLPILLAVSFGDRLLLSFFQSEPSGKTLAQELRRVDIPADQLFVKNIRRGKLYSLSFYLRQEVQEWDLEHPHAGYLLLGRRSCQGMVGDNFSCEEIPFDVDKIGYFLFRVRPLLVGGAAGGGKAE